MNIENGTMKESYMGDRTMEKLLKFAESNENKSLPIVIKKKKGKTGKRKQRGGKKHKKTLKRKKRRSHK